MRFFIGFIIALGLIIALIVLLLQGGNSSTPKEPALSTYANTSTIVRVSIDGPVTAPQNHNQIVVTVGRDRATYQQFNGYDGTIIASKSYDNSFNSYNTFLHAISRAGMLVGNTDPKLSNSLGRCPLGQIYTFEVLNGDKQIKKLWTTNCGGAKTFGGNTNLIMSLFQSQIPDYSDLSQNVRI